MIAGYFRPINFIIPFNFPPKILIFLSGLYDSMIMNKNIIKHDFVVQAGDRERLKGHRGVCLWFTGLSGSGKSTLANHVEQELLQLGLHTYILDGDNIRHGLNSDLGFSPEDREENIRRIGEVARLFVDSGTIVLTSFISPYRSDRNRVRMMIPQGRFIEVYVKCDLEVCKTRDPKGLYRKALNGEIPEFTGVSAPYEEPLNPELVLDNSHESDLQKNVTAVIDYLLTINIKDV